MCIRDRYYGINALSNNLIMVDRKLLKNPNGLILGTPGSGKSFSAKREIANCFLLTNDDIIICDPEAEYAPLVERLHEMCIRDSIIVCVAIYAVLVQSIATESDIIMAIWSCVGYTVLLCFTLFKTGSLAKSVFNAH